jgi:hypothetical protein
MYIVYQMDANAKLRCEELKDAKVLAQKQWGNGKVQPKPGKEDGPHRR